MLKFLLGVILMALCFNVMAACPDIYNHQFVTLKGEKINFCDFQDKPLLVVNTASKCGFTPQFDRLESIYKKFKDRGLVVIGFPSNDFNQELSTNKEIGDFCLKTYSVQFPMMSKSSVVGVNANPLYKQLANSTMQPPMWNFYKYLILPGGKQIYAFSSDVEPESEEILEKFKPFLK